MPSDVQAAFDLENLRLWDLPAAKPEDAIKMNKRAKNYTQPKTNTKTKKEMGLEKMIDDIRGREQPESAGGGESGLPGCEVNNENMDLSPHSLAHLRENDRVSICHDSGACPPDQVEPSSPGMTGAERNKMLIKAGIKAHSSVHILCVSAHHQVAEQGLAM